MSAFKPLPEIVIDDMGAEYGVYRLMTKGGDDIFTISDCRNPDEVQRLVDCWNACRKLYSPAAHIAETDAYVARLEALRKEAVSRIPTAQAAE